MKTISNETAKVACQAIDMRLEEMRRNLERAEAHDDEPDDIAYWKQRISVYVRARLELDRA